ncbi:hypothetical protein MMC29_008464, partial [Sticta canariensis]|nr:hypothetical protein [Sticta canariensis]
MAPPHTISPSKNARPRPRPRPGPLTKPVRHRSMVQARLNMSSYSQPSQPATPAPPTMPTMPDGETTIIEQFRLHREKNTENLSASLPENPDIQR